MSRANVELTRRFIELFNTREFQAFFELLDPDIVYRNREDEPDVEDYHGREAVKRYVAGWLDMFDDLLLQAREFVDLGDEVIIVTDLVARGRETGADVRGRYVFLFEIREGVIVRGREYATTEEALAAAGSKRSAEDFRPRS